MMKDAVRARGLRPERRRVPSLGARAPLLALLFACVMQPPHALAAEEGCTLALVAAHPESGQVAYGVLSSLPAGTANLAWSRAGVGAVAVLGDRSGNLALRGLDFLAQGVTVDQAVTALVEEAPAPDRLQIAMVNAAADTAARSGTGAPAWKGHLEGTMYACLASGARSEKVLLQMGVAFETARGDLIDRLLVGLLAGQGAEADHHPMRSASVRITGADPARGTRQLDPSAPAPMAFSPTPIDLRVDDHEDPLREARRLLRVLDEESLHRLGSRPIEQTQGEDVYQVQVMLSNLGFYEGSENGVLNDATVDAIRAFRRQEGLEDLPLLDGAALRSLLLRHQEWKTKAPETPRSPNPPVETETFPAPPSNPN